MRDHGLTDRFLLFFSIIAIGFASSIVPAQDGAPPAWLYKVNHINVKGFTRHYNTYDWVVTGPQTSVVFANDIDDITGTYSLVTYCLNQQGKVKKPATIFISDLPGIQSYPSYYPLLAVSAVWVGDNSSGATEQPGRGVLLAAYDPSGEEKQIIVVSAEFDAAGNRIGELTRLLQINVSDKNGRANNFGINASLGENSIGVSFFVFFSEFTQEFIGTYSTEGYFIETDLNGSPYYVNGSPPSIRKVPLPNGGKMKEFQAFKPAWNGGRWLVPCAVTRLKLKRHAYQHYTDVSVPIGNDICVVVAEDGRSALKLMKLFGNNDRDNYWFYNLQFLPRESLAGGQQPPDDPGDDLDLLCQQILQLPYDEPGLDSYDYSYGLLKIDGDGRQVGNEILVDLPPWQHRIKYIPGWKRNHSFDYLSQVIAGPDGRLYFGLTRSLEMYHEGTSSPITTSYMHDHELRLYSINRDTGNLTSLALGYPQIGDATFRGVWINTYQSGITLVNTSLPHVGIEYYYCLDYFTKFATVGN
jgi:hypothetical protein